MGKETEAPELLTPADVAHACQPLITPAAVRAAERAGRIRAAYKTPSGGRLFERAEVDRFLQARRSKSAA